MALDKDTIRNRNYIQGLVYKLEKFIGEKFTALGKSVETLGNKVLKVNVENIPKLTEYTKELSEIDNKLGDVVFKLQTLADKEEPKSLEELNKISDLIKAVNSIEIPTPDKFDTSKLEKAMANTTKAINGLKLTTNVDLLPVVKAIVDLNKQVANIQMPDIPAPPVYDNTNIVSEIRSLQKTMLTVAKTESPQTVNLDGLSSKLDGVVEAIKNMPQPNIPEFDFPKTIAVNNFPPQKIPQPVTNININPLRGIVHSTSTIIGTTPSGLPGYGVLEGRRAIVFFNTSSDTTLYIGGSGVSASNGLPVPANSYSPSFDSGPLQAWYGVTSSGNVNVRTIELQNDSGG